jgi:hypothetical protein
MKNRFPNHVQFSSPIRQRSARSNSAPVLESVSIRLGDFLCPDLHFKATTFDILLSTNSFSCSGCQSLWFFEDASSSQTPNIT